MAAFGVRTCPADGAQLMAGSPAGSDLPLLSPGLPNAPTDLMGEVRCDPVRLTSTAQLTWKAPRAGGGQQRVDVTAFRDGFQTANFVTFGPLPPDQFQVELSSGEPGITYYWRVLTLTESGWAPSRTARLPWLGCPSERLPGPSTREKLKVDVDNLHLSAKRSEADLERATTRMSAVAPAQSISFEDVNPDQSNNPFFVRGSGGRVNGLASVPANNQVFYAASEWGGLYKTQDGGRRWKRLDGHLPAVTWDVEVNPADPQIVYATSFYDGRVESGAGINISQDGGTTWEHPATATPPPAPAFNCEPVRRQEPLAFGISIDPRAPDSVYIGYSCGLAISNDRGRTWRFVDPEQFVNPDPSRPAVTVVDVLAHHDEHGNAVIDVCGNAGHFRSEDGGNSWRAGTGLPSGVCSIAVSPDESYVLLAVVGTTIYQTVDGGNNWVNNVTNPDAPGGGRLPLFVATNQRSNDAGQDIFDLWFGDIHMYRFRCTTPPARMPGGPPRCPANPATGSLINGGAHVDVGDIAFDSQARSDACPVIFSSDGGVYRNTLTSSPDCHNPGWTQPEVTPHAMWLWAMVGAHQPGSTAEDLYFSTQDNAAWGTSNAGATKPDWNNKLCCDVFDLAATPSSVLFMQGVPLSLELVGRRLEDPVLRTIIPPSPGIRGLDGGLIGFLFPDTIDQWGPDRFALVTADCTGGASCVLGPRGGDGGLFVTVDAGLTWTELGHPTEPPTGGTNRGFMCAVMASRDPRTQEAVFYVQVGFCQTDGKNRDELWRFVGIDPNGQWQRIRLPSEGEGSGISIFAVDRSNANRLYASLITAGRDPRMIFSEDGGGTWQLDGELDALMHGHGVFRYQTRIGPTPFLGFGGYAQPSLLAFDPNDRNLIIAGGHDSGVFLSRDGGKHWDLVTDPFDPVGSGIPHLTSPRYAYFDHDVPDAIDIYMGTVGRGVWRMRIPRFDLARVDGFSGKAQGVGRGAMKTGIGIIGTFLFNGKIDLDADSATLTISRLLNDGKHDVEDIPLTLAVTSNSERTAHFQTAAGAVPIASVTIGDKGGGKFLFSIKVTKATIGLPDQCPNLTLTTVFSINDRLNPHVLVSTDQPWRCFGLRNESLKSP
jgi:photosystem II stability/assembly factor-like uncharacterized protein